MTEATDSQPRGATISFSVLEKNNTRERLFVVIHGKVYNVTNFLDEHPGGDEVILAEGGKDATEAFEDVGHSDEARALLPNMFVGELEQSSVPLPKKGGSPTQVNVASVVEQGSNLMYFVPLGVLSAYIAWRYYSTGSLL